MNARHKALVTHLMADIELYFDEIETSAAKEYRVNLTLEKHAANRLRSVIQKFYAEATLSDALIEMGRWRSIPGALIGMKPPSFAAWMFGQLGAIPGDELVDLFPGSGAIGRAWARFGLRYRRDASLPVAADASAVDRREPSPFTAVPRDKTVPCSCLSFRCDEPWAICRLRDGEAWLAAHGEIEEGQFSPYVPVVRREGVPL